MAGDGERRRPPRSDDMPLPGPCTPYLLQADDRLHRDLSRCDRLAGERRVDDWASGCMLTRREAAPTGPVLNATRPIGSVSYSRSTLRLSFERADLWSRFSATSPIEAAVDRAFSRTPSAGVPERSCQDTILSDVLGSAPNHAGFSLAVRSSTSMNRGRRAGPVSRGGKASRVRSRETPLPRRSF